MARLRYDRPQRATAALPSPAPPSIANSPHRLREVVLDAASDEFYVRHRYSNYGEVGLAVKEAVEKFSTTSAQHRQVGA